MPVTQTLEFSAGTGLTLSCKLFALGSDTVVDTQTATERTNDKNRYVVNFVDIPAGTYRLNAFIGATGGFANEVYDLTLSTATFQPRSESDTLRPIVPGRRVNVTAAGNVIVEGDSFGNTLVIPNLAIEATSQAIKAKTDLITAGSGTGARSVSLTVTTTANQPIQNAFVRLEIPGLAYYATTNVNGVAAFSLDDATYSLAITAPGYSFSPATLVVSGNTSQTYQMTSLAQVSPPAFAGLCNVLFAVIHLGQPVANASVTAILEDENPTVNNYLISRQINTGTTDANGLCVLTMIQFDQFTRGGVYRIKVADTLGRTIHDRRVKVPTASTANAEDLIDAR